MATARTRSVLHLLQQAVLNQDERAGDDAQLLEAFAHEGSEFALQALLRRHGPMVMGVCQRVLHHLHDAEDAFQAAFLVLARKGKSLRNPQLLGNWLYGVAYRCALHIRSANLRRRAFETQVAVMPESAAHPDPVSHDLRALLDRELERLPEKYRVALVLCDLEGRSRREVARQLALPEGTLSSRLAAARRLLAKRLSRRGVALPAGILAVLLAQQAQAAVSPAVAQATFHAAAQLAAGQVLTSLGVSGAVAATFNGVLRSILITKLKWLASASLALSLIAGMLSMVLAAGGVQPQRGDDLPARAQGRDIDPAGAEENALAKHLQGRSWTLKSANLKNSTITICDRPAGGSGFQLIFENPNAALKAPDQKGAVLEGLRVAEDAKVVIDGRAAKLADLREGMTLLLKIAGTKTRVSEIQVITKAREERYFVEAIHLKQGIITVRANHGTFQLPLAKDVKMISLLPPQGGNQALPVEGPLTDLAKGTPVHLQMGMEGDRLVVRALKISQ